MAENAAVRGAAVYLDYNATAPVLPEVAEAVRGVLASGHGNPSSLHRSGRCARAFVEESRATILARLGGEGGELVFTSGGSEANALAILGGLRDRAVAHVVAPAAGLPAAGLPAGDGRHVVVGATEHPSTIDVVRRLERAGIVEVTPVSPAEDGRVSPDAIRAALRPQTVLVSLHHANNETGVIQDVDGVGKVCRSQQVTFHCDAVQTVGKLPLELNRLGADLITMSSHKVHGPGGAGALWIHPEISFHHPWGGGPQEKGLRPGTENVPGVVGFACAVDHLQITGPELRDRLWTRIRSGSPGAVRNGSPEFVVPNTLNVSFPGLRAETLLLRLDMEGVQASSGSACASGAREPSHVLEAMGLSRMRVAGALRFSLGRGLSECDVERAAAIVVRCARQLSGGARGRGS